jgi:hypothetical protein
MSDQGKEHNLTVHDVKSISDKLIHFLEEESQTSKPYILGMIIDQVKTDLDNAYKLKHDPRKWLK